MKYLRRRVLEDWHTVHVERRIQQAPARPQQIHDGVLRGVLEREHLERRTPEVEGVDGGVRDPRAVGIEDDEVVQSDIVVPHRLHHLVEPEDFYAYIRIRREG